MVEFRLHSPAHLVVGRNVVGTVANEIRRSAGDRALMITEASLADSGAADTIRDALDEVGIVVAYYTGLTPASLSDAAEEAVELGRSGRVQLVLGFGSSVTLSHSRVVAALMQSELDIDDVLDDQRITSPGVPFIAIPSEPLDPFLFAPRALIADARNREVRLIGLAAPPRYVLIDRSSFDGMSKIRGGYDLVASLMLGIEGLISRRGTPLSAPMHERVISSSVAALEASSNGEDTSEFFDKVAQIAMQVAYASSRTGIGLSIGSSAVLHALTGLGMYAAVPSLIGPTVSAFARNIPERKPLLASLLGVENRDGEVVPETLELRVRDIVANANLPLRLRDLGIDESLTRSIGGNVESMGLLSNYSGAIGLEDLGEIVTAAM